MASDACHSRGIIHCDVEPGKIMFNALAGESRLINFAQAQYYVEEKFSIKERNRVYQAPEMLLNGRVCFLLKHYARL